MSLAPGQSMLHYTLIEQIGAGGMGVVYRATDKKLRRDVAIKVLPDDFAKDQERLARFEREAHVLASLNHPGIAAIHGLEESEGVRFLVLELVSGETLADRLSRGALPVDEALAVARQIAEALEEAHEHGIVHRDLKPANVKLTADGKVKVLDFGLAKALEGDQREQDLSRSPTATVEGTRSGVIVGTAPYMSPEQARAKPVDRRTDIFAFGSLLYEMLTGQKAFKGDTISDTMAAILEREPDWNQLPSMLQPQIQELLRRCLRKDPSQRLQHVGEARIRLAETSMSETDSVRSVNTSGRALMWSAVVGALVGIAVTSMTLLRPNPPSTGEVIRLSMETEEGWILAGGPIAFSRPSRQAFTISPNGRTLVYAAGNRNFERVQLFRRNLNQEHGTPIPGTTGAGSPFFSYDGQSVGFFVGKQLMRVPLEGGEPRTISVAPPSFVGAWASWTEDDTILLVSQDGVLRVPANGGATTRLTTVDRGKGETDHRFPQMLPGGDALLFNVVRGQIPSTWDVVVKSLATGARRVIVEGGSDPRYVYSGHIVFARRGALMAVPFDAERLQVIGDPVVVLEDLMHTEHGSNSTRRTGDGQFSVSRSGTLAYVRGGVYPLAMSKIVWVDHVGRVDSIPIALHRNLNPRVSPHGTRLAYDRGPTGARQIWVYDFETGLPVPLTSQGDNAVPVWSPDGSRIAFASDGADQSPLNIFWIAADGSGEPQRLTRNPRVQYPHSWSRDNVLALIQYTTTEQRAVESKDLMTLRMDGQSEPQPFVETPFVEQYPTFSPDGKWVAYSSNQTGQQEVWVRPFPRQEPAYRISTDGGRAPVWSPDGRQLFYKTSTENSKTTVMVVDVTAGSRFERRQPRKLFEGRFGDTRPMRSFDISADGNRFVMITPTFDPSKLQPVKSIHTVVNWFDELKRLTAEVQ